MTPSLNKNPLENRYYNRELSWLQFNARVLQEAEDETTPLLERLRFIGIFSNNLDEFFKVRYATIKRIAFAGKGGRSFLGGITASELLDIITQTVIKQQEMSLGILGGIKEELKKEHIFMIDETEVSKSQSEYIADYFIQNVSPVMVVIMIGELERFPSLKDNAAYLAIKMEMSQGDTSFGSKNSYALIEIPKNVQRFVELPSQDGKKYIIILDDLIRYSLHQIFSIFKYDHISAHMIKITRDAALDIESDLSKSFIDKISKSVKNRSDGDPVRLVYDNTIDDETLSFLMDKMGIKNSDSINPGGRYHNRRDYIKFPSLGRPDLQYEKIVPLPIPGLNLVGSILDKVAKK
ncbi:MAG: polyphosphate kinase, partial [Patiriisocius sp.]